MPDAPTPVLPAYTPSTPTAPTAVQAGGTPSAPSAPANSAGSGVVSAPTAPTAVQAGGQPSAPSAPANSTGSGAISAPTAPTAVQSGGQPSAPSAPAASISAAPIIPAAIASKLFDPTGANNSILITAKESGTGGNAIQVSLPIDVVEGNEFINTAPDVGYLMGSYNLNCGPAYRLRITGTLTSDGSTPVTFPALIGAPDVADRSAWSATGAAVTIGTSNSVRWDSGNSCWRAQSGDSVWLSYDAVFSPQLCTTWVAQGSATGTPVFASEACTAAEMIAAINADTSLPFTAANGPGSDGSGAVAGVVGDYLAGGAGPNPPSAIHP